DIAARVVTQQLTHGGDAQSFLEDLVGGRTLGAGAGPPAGHVRIDVQDGTVQRQQPSRARGAAHSTPMRKGNRGWPPSRTSICNPGNDRRSDSSTAPRSFCAAPAPTTKVTTSASGAASFRTNVTAPSAA